VQLCILPDQTATFKVSDATVRSEPNHLVLSSTLYLVIRALRHGLQTADGCCTVRGTLWSGRGEDACSVTYVELIQDKSQLSAISKFRGFSLFFLFSKFLDNATRTAAALRADTFGLRPIVGIFRTLVLVEAPLDARTGHRSAINDMRTVDVVVDVVAYLLLATGVFYIQREQHPSAKDVCNRRQKTLGQQHTSLHCKQHTQHRHRE